MPTHKVGLSGLVGPLALSLSSVACSTPKDLALMSDELQRPEKTELLLREVMDNLHDSSEEGLYYDASSIPEHTKSYLTVPITYIPQDIPQSASTSLELLITTPTTRMPAGMTASYLDRLIEKVGRVDEFEADDNQEELSKNKAKEVVAILSARELIGPGFGAAVEAGYDAR